MKPIKAYITILLLIAGAFLVNTGAQENLNQNGRTFQFKPKPLAHGDSLQKFYCMMRMADLLAYKSITVNYNNRSKKFLTKNLLTYKSADYTVNRDFILFNIDEKLNEPFVILEGEDAQGKKYNLCQRNANGEIIDPAAERAKWRKAVDRVDSMDYVKKFDNVFIGRDGRPRYKGQDGNIYIIEKSSTKLDY
jgi:hypothetical protein